MIHTTCNECFYPVCEHLGCMCQGMICLDCRPDLLRPIVEFYDEHPSKSQTGSLCRQIAVLVKA